MTDFVAIDFETASQHRPSVCSGVVIVRNGEMDDYLPDAQACAMIAMKIL